MIYGRDLTKPYKTIEHSGIAYTTCKEFNHISRYRNLRQVIHLSDSGPNLTTLETSNPFVSHTEVKYHEVSVDEIDRLDIVAQKELGASTYGWVIAYFNNIADGYSIREGQKLMIPNSVTELLSTGEVLAPVTALKLNLGEE